MFIIIRLLIIFLVYYQGIITIQYPIGPSFISTITTKQKIYYNNLGTRLDCSVTGNPLPTILWFRINTIDDQSLISIQSSELIDLFKNGSLFIRPFQEYFKPIHAGLFLCQATNPIGSIKSIPIQLKPQIYDAYEIEVKNPYGFEQSSVIISCEISPPIASSYVNIIGWLEKVNNQIIQLDLQPKTKYNLLSNKNLIIHNLTKFDDNKSYACMIKNQIDNNTKQSQFKSLRVRDRSLFGHELSVPNNTEYQGQVGDAIELPCGIASLSINAQISWRKDGSEIKNVQEKIYQNSLIFRLSSNDSGIYTCRVNDELIGRMTSMMSLKINIPTECKINIQQTNIRAGSDTELSCEINSIKTTTISWQWYHNSMLLSTKFNRYIITNTTRKHMGMYQCCYIATSSDSNSCCAQTQIRVINSPPFILPVDQIHLNSIIISPKTMSNNRIDLNCTVYGDPIPEINIYKDGEKLLLNNQIEYLPSGDIFLHYPIYISNINDTGLYECHAKNSFGSISLSKHINIDKQKPFIQSLKNRTIHMDEQFTLKCYVSGQPNLFLQWIDEINNQIVNTSSTSPILFTSINPKSNIYRCQAKNSFGEISSKIFLTIQNPARILSTTSNKTIKINQSLDIYCSAEGDNQFEMLLKTPSITKKYDNNKNVSMIIDHVQMSDSGLYECYVKNNYSEDRSIFEIIVQNIPDRIENIFIENSERIFWVKPFDGNSKIFKYILRIQYKQDLLWSNETIINIDNNEITNYSFENIFTKCILSVIIQAENKIGLSLPSDPILFQTNIKGLPIAPFNLTAVNISSKSIILTWQYPSFYICNDSIIKFIIEITDSYHQTVIRTHNHHSRVSLINQLKSFTHYTFVIYAMNEFGSSPKSKPLEIRTIESVPYAMIGGLKANLLNSSTAYITWTFEQTDFRLINGHFRAFAVAIYENFNMSTLTTIETSNTNLILHNLQSSSQYFISVSICNSFDCGSSSVAIDIKTPPSSFDTSTVIIHPINKPLVFDCPLLSNTSYQYQCGSQLFDIRYYDKPSSIRVNIHYKTSNEIGLKILYPLEIIEKLIITYKIKDTLFINQLNVSPPLMNVRLTNLSCGNIYEIMIYASNQVGFSLTEYLITKTEGSVPLLMEAKDLFETISNNYIIINMEKWIIDECPILSYEIEIFPVKNSSEINSYRYLSSKNQIQIDNLQSNQDYQLNIKIHSQIGENIEQIYFRTKDNNDQLRIKNQQILLIMIFIASFLLMFVFVLFIIKLFKKTGLFKRDNDNLPYNRNLKLFIDEKRKLKPILYSHTNHRHYQKTWVKAENDSKIDNYIQKNRSDSFASEDSQGNINPYAVTGYAMNCKDNKQNHSQSNTPDIHRSTGPSERYFCPIVIESSSPNDRDSSTRHPKKLLLSNNLSTVSSSADSGVHSSYTQSPRCPLRNISFDRANQDNPLYATYDEGNLPSHGHHQYSLV